MNAQDFRSLQEAYMEVVENQQLDEVKKQYPYGKVFKQTQRLMKSDIKSGDEDLKKSNKLFGRHERIRNLPYFKLGEPEHRLQDSEKTKKTPKQKKPNPFGNRLTRSDRQGIRDSYDYYDIILSHLLDEGYAETQEQAEVIMVNMSEDWRQDIMEKEDSEYEKASDAALDSRYGYGRATGSKTSFGRAANRASAAAMLRRLRKDRDEGRTTSRESGADAVHQGWAHTARTSSDQTPEKKERRAKLADTSYSNLPDDEKEKDRVSADAVRAVYNRNKR
jgi:hypothetical protein